MQLALFCLFVWHGTSQAQSKAIPKAQIVLLGTGTPLPDPERSGPGTAIIVNGTPYHRGGATSCCRPPEGCAGLGHCGPENRFHHASAL
jgi:hypothetical protein